MSDASETVIPKGVLIALGQLLKMLKFEPEPVIAMIEQISHNVAASKRDQDEILRLVRENNDMLKAKKGKTDVVSN